MRFRWSRSKLGRSLALLGAGGLVAGWWIGSWLGERQSIGDERELPGLANVREKGDSLSGNRMDWEASDVREALELCRLGSESGEMSKAHYYALHAAKALEPPELVALIRVWAGETGFEAGTIQLILWLELALRDEEALLGLLCEPEMSGLPPGLLSRLFYYWSAWRPEEAMAAVEKLPLGLRRAAIALMQGTLGGEGKAWIATMRNRIASEEREAKIREREAERTRRREEARKQVADLIEQNKWSDPQLSGLFAEAYGGDLQAGMKAIRSVSDAWGRKMLLDAFLGRHGGSPLEGLEAVDSLYRDGLLKGAGNRLRHLRSLAREGLARDVEGTLAWMEAALNEREQIALFSQMSANRFSHPGSFLASELLNQLPESPTKMRLEDQAVSELAGKDWPAAVAWLGDKPHAPRYDRLRATLITRAFQVGGAEAAREWIQQIDTPESRATATTQLASAWGRQEPLAYAEWLSQLDDAEAVKRGMAQLGHYWAQSDPEEALHFATALPAGELRSQMQMAVTSRLAQDNPLRAIEFAMSIESDQEMKAAVRTAVERWSRIDPIRALEFLQSSFPDDREFDSQVTAAAQTWARTDPVAVVAYFTERADSAHGYLGLAAGFENWMNIDREAATDFLDRVPAGEARDRLLLHTVTSAYRLLQDDELALQLASRIDDPDIREQASEYLSRRLSPGAALGGGRP